MIEFLKTLNLYSNLIIAIATVVLAIITGIYVFYTRKILQENKMMRKDTYKIIVQTKELEAFSSLHKKLNLVILSIAEELKIEKRIKRMKESLLFYMEGSPEQWVELAEDFLNEYKNCSMILPISLKVVFYEAFESLSIQTKKTSTNRSFVTPKTEDFNNLLRIFKDVSYKGQEIFGLRAFPISKKKKNKRKLKNMED